LKLPSRRKNLGENYGKWSRRSNIERRLGRGFGEEIESMPTERVARANVAGGTENDLTATSPEQNKAGR
jgi:hypothetical protein